MLKKISPSVVTYLLLLESILVLRLLLVLSPAGQIARQMVNFTDSISIGTLDDRLRRGVPCSEDGVC